MTEAAKSGTFADWICHRCQAALELQKVRLQYLGSIFAYDLPACPKCGMILIEEDLAVVKMAEAEQILEDK